MGVLSVAGRIHSNDPMDAMRQFDKERMLPTGARRVMAARRINRLYFGGQQRDIWWRCYACLCLGVDAERVRILYATELFVYPAVRHTVPVVSEQDGQAERPNENEVQSGASGYARAMSRSATAALLAATGPASAFGPVPDAGVAVMMWDSGSSARRIN